MLKLKELRQEKGLSQEQLAAIINVKNYTIGNWEQERSEPSIADIIKIADYFEISTDYLLGRSNDIGIIETNANLTQFENMLLSVVNSLTRDDQFQVLGFAQALAK